MKHFSGDVSQSIPTTVVEVCQLLMINAKQMQQCGMQVVNGDAVRNSTEANFIELTITGPLANSRTRHEHAKPIWIVIASAVSL